MDAWFTSWTAWIRRHESSLLREKSPTTLTIDLHHLYYLLLRCEGLGYNVGPLDVSCRAKHAAAVKGINASPTKTATHTSDTYSVLSLQHTIQSVSTWWGRASSGKEDEADPDKMYAYLYSILSRVSSLCVTPPPSSIDEAEFADFPGSHATPLLVCKEITHLALDGVDPTSIVGWHRLCIQLTSLSCSHVSLTDVTDIFVGLVQRDQPTEATDVPAAAWHSLRFLRLPHDELTFVPASALDVLPSLVHIDLSHNLLNAIPPALECESHLLSLNLSHNMIDSVLGIYKSLPHIQALNLSGNRLESLCGLERLHTLRQVDLRQNWVSDPGEVGRLATLPHISHAWIASNPLCHQVPDARVACFYTFALEHKDICLDDIPCSFFERRRVSGLLARRMATQPRRASSSIEARLSPQVRRITTSSSSQAVSKGTSEARKKKTRASPTKTSSHSVDSYKQQMEKLRDNMGDDWLRVVAANGSGDPFRVHAPMEKSERITARTDDNDAPILAFPWAVRLFIETVSTPVGAALTSATALAGGLFIWWRFFRRIPNASYITPATLRARRRIVGRVTRYVSLIVSTPHARILTRIRIRSQCWRR